MSNDRTIGYSSNYFEVPKRWVIFPILPPAFVAGTNTIPFTISGVDMATLTLILKDPEMMLTLQLNQSVSVLTQKEQRQ